MERIRDLRYAAQLPYFWRRVFPFFDAVKFQETIFALPFAYSGMVLAADGLPTVHQFCWITVCMIAGRTLGMSANRFIDRNIDALNPRTARRHIPARILHASDMAVLAIVAATVLLIASAQLNLMSLVLAPVGAAYLVFYSFTKRFTWAASLFLGFALAIAPSAAWIGVKGTLSWQPALLSLAVVFWATSFDILYHTQDKQFYLHNHLYSVSARFGIVAAFRWAKVLDVFSVMCLVGLGVLMELRFPYFVGCSFAAGLLLVRYFIISPNDISKLGIAFTRINAYVSTVIFLAVLATVTL